jgi:hypothetical protein
MKFSNLNSCKLFPEGNDIEVWYFRPERFADFSFETPSDFDPNNLSKTHICLGTLADIKNSGKTEVIERLFRDLQGERWSRNGEARELIRGLGLAHTSMSVGDVIRFKSGEVYLCKDAGWERYETFAVEE